MFLNTSKFSTTGLEDPPPWTIVLLLSSKKESGQLKKHFFSFYHRYHRAKLSEVDPILFEKVTLSTLAISCAHWRRPENMTLGNRGQAGNRRRSCMKEPSAGSWRIENLGFNHLWPFKNPFIPIFHDPWRSEFSLFRAGVNHGCRLGCIHFMNRHCPGDIHTLI